MSNYITMRKRKIGRYGNAWVIKLSPVDIKDFGIVDGDEVDIDDLNLIQMENDDSQSKSKAKSEKKK